MICGKDWTQSPTVTFLLFSHNVSLLSEIYFYLLFFTYFLKTKMELVKEEALNICSPFKWSGFLCVLALSSVCLCFVHCYYKSYDVMLKYKIMFNQLIKLRVAFPSFNSDNSFIIL